MGSGKIGLTANGREEDGEDVEDEVGAGCAHFGGCAVLMDFFEGIDEYESARW